MDKAPKATDIRHDENGGENLDPTPMQPPLGYRRAPTLSEQIRQQVIAAKLDEWSMTPETEEEADDFVVGDDYEPISKHENDHIPTIAVLKERAMAINKEIEKQNLVAMKKKLADEYRLKYGKEPPQAAPPSPEPTPENPPPE